MTTTTERSCPKCGSACYDNRAENMDRVARGEKARPEFKCKKCEWVQWAPKGGNGAAPRQAAPPPELGPRIAGLDDVSGELDELYGLYDLCFAHALAVAKRAGERGVQNVDGAVVASIAATLFIQAKR